MQYLMLKNSFSFHFANYYYVLMFLIQPTDFKKLFDDEIAKLKASSSRVPQNDPLFRQFTAAIWV